MGSHGFAAGSGEGAPLRKTKANEMQRPSIAVELQGQLHCTPMARMEAACDKFIRSWEARAAQYEDFPELECLNARSLPRLRELTAEDVLQAARPFGPHTSRSYGGLHPPPGTLACCRRAAVRR